MNKKTSKAIIISMSSDIGHALAKRWQQRGIGIAGTFRRPSAQIKELQGLGAQAVPCDLENTLSVSKACAALSSEGDVWDYLVLCPGDLEPIGAFADSDFAQWERSLEVNFIKQLQIVHQLLPTRNKKARHPPVVLFFAGGGTNGATVNYSAYTLSKIALMKMCELLDAEIPDTSFVILGPGWVKTKIHQASLDARDRAGANYQKTKDKLAGDECTPIEKVLDCCDWIIEADPSQVSGRNFSVVSDQWGTPGLEAALSADANMYKLRRSGNDWKEAL